MGKTAFTLSLVTMPRQVQEAGGGLLPGDGQPATGHATDLGRSGSAR